MPQTPKQVAGVILLTGAIRTSPMAERSLEEQLSVPAIRMTVPRVLPPLDLDAPFFRYRTKKVARTDPARICHDPHRR